MSSFTKKINRLRVNYPNINFRLIMPVILFVLICVIIAVSFSFCSKTEVDLRTLAPKDTLIYLETNNLGDMLNSLTESKSFKESSDSKLDLSVVDGMQMAVAISGFETSEDQVTDAQAVLSFKPKFTAIAETHGWGWQVRSLVENSLNDFVRKTYGSDAKLEKKSVNDTERFIWTASDGRKTFAVISGSQVFFGNDEESINKCLLAKRGEAESLLKNENLSLEYEKAKGKLAFGFISNEGINQIADLVGVTVAVGQSEDENARGFISRILPQILSNTTREITWTAEQTVNGIEDEIFIKTENETSKVLSQTLVSSTRKAGKIYDFLPPQTSTVTRYNLKNPQIAFRSLLLVTANNTDAVNAKIISAFSNSLLLQYGIADAEMFLSEVESELITAKIDEASIAIVQTKDLEKIKESFIEDLKADSDLTETQKVEIWKSAENDLAVVFFEDILLMGDAEGVLKCVAAWRKRKISPLEAEKDFTKSQTFLKLLKSTAVAATFSKDAETTETIVKVLGKPNQKGRNSNNYTLVETSFNRLGIKRSYISDFGFLGTIIEQFGD